MMIRKFKKPGVSSIFLIFLSIFFISVSNTNAQKYYGNDWIDYNGREYFKIKVNKDGFYRVDFNALNNFNLSGKNPDEAHLWFRGKQVPILIKHNGDNKFDAGEFIEFYGQRNDGTLDSVLYVNPSNQPHKDISLYMDTSVYFLTFSATETKSRIKEHPSNTSTTISPASFFIEESAQFFSEEYYRDLPFIPEQGYSSAEYKEGEGYQSTLIRKGNSREVILATPALTNNGIKPEIEFLIYGRSDYNDALTNNPSAPNDKSDHNLVVQVRAANGTFREILNITYNGHKRQHYKFQLDYADVGPQTYVRVTSKGLGHVPVDDHVIAFIKIKYPRLFTFSGYKAHNFNYQNPNNDSINHFSFSGLNVSSGDILYLYDKTNGIRTKGFLQGSDLHFTIPNLGSSSYFLFNESEIASADITEKVIFPKFDYNAGYNYLIVTNKKLLTAAREFADYKAGTRIDSSGNFKPLVVTMDQLTDQFFYGVYHPASIQRFCAYMYNNATQKPPYLLLLGKGYAPEVLKKRKNYQPDMVPIIGTPSSDALYTAGLDVDFKGVDPTIDPIMAVGRISAKNETNVRVYLDKLKDFENAPRHPWQKHIMHISAGDVFNQDIIRSYMDKVSNIIRSPYVGATLWRYNNSVPSSINTELIERIQTEINSGASMLTYFGHGSASGGLGVEIGRPDYMLQDASATGKFPFFNINGCQAGTIEADTASSEGWIFADNKGAIGWVAHSSTGYVPPIGWQLQQFYNNLNYNFYGHSIGTIWRHTLRDHDQSPHKNDELYRNISITYNLQGDPSVRLHFQPLPDYALYDTSMSVFPEDAIAGSDSIAIRIDAYNLGKVTEDSFEVRIQRIFPGGQSFTYDVKKYPPLFNKTTIDYWMKTGAFRAQGINNVIVTIDPLNKVSETDELNNSANFSFNLTGNGVRQLFPVEYGIVSVDNPELIIQARDLFDSKTGSYFEIDTNLTFSSPWVKRSPLISGSHLMKWQPNLLNKDTVVYYWRARLDIDSGQAGEWETRSFTFIRNSPEGWSQSHFQQYTSIFADDIIIDTTIRRFRFQKFFEYLTLKTHPFLSAGLGITPEGGSNYNPRVCAANNLIFVEFDKNTLDPVALFPTCPRNSSSWDFSTNYIHYRQFNMLSATTTVFPDGTKVFGRDSFVNFVNNIQEGNYVALVTKPGSRIQKFFDYDEATLQAFEKLGATQIRTAAANTRDTAFYVLLGKKSNTKGKAVNEKLLYNYQAPWPQDTVYAEFKAAMEGEEPTGYYSSAIIGPAKKWKTFNFSFSEFENPDDIVTFSLIGIDKQNRTVVLSDSITQNGYDLSGIDAKEYPFIQLRAQFSDYTNRSAPQLKIWQVLYDGVPEGTMVIDKDFVFFKDTLSQGDSLKIAVKFRNISRHPMDSVLVRYQIENTESKSEITFNNFYKPLPPDSQLNIKNSFSTAQLKPGAHRINVFVNPDYQQPEITLDNNFITLPSFIKGDKTNPVMDVTFDGRHIMDGELVSAKPLILISNKDESRNRILNDTSLFKIMLKKTNDPRPADTIRFNSGQLTFRPGSEANNKASVEFRPQNLEDGVYELTVQAYDASGNKAGEDDYRITFEVINKSMVSNFFVYPNPFTTRARFVFTLTGSEIPSFMKVQIMTITGKVVKEITKEELGDLHIGNNITNYSWDGTDEYGDMLANGLYMYRVIVKNNDGKQLEAYKTGADKFFEQNFGKLYILR